MSPLPSCPSSTKHPRPHSARPGSEPLPAPAPAPSALPTDSPTTDSNVTQRFLAFAAHDLRAPLSRLHGHLELLQTLRCDGALTDALLDRSLQRMDRAVQGLTTLLSDLLRLAQLDAKQLPLQREPENFPKLIVECVVSVAEWLSPNHQFQLDIDHSLPLISLDAASLRRVVQNVLDNAVKYSPDGGTVRVSLKSDPTGGVELTITDGGIGLPRGSHDVIWQAFGRADNANGAALGLGLGLYISQRLVAAHGGRIWAESPGEGRGTAIHIWLPDA